MKAEQQLTEGISGILATVEQEQGMVWFSLRLCACPDTGSLSELAGESDQLPQPGLYANCYKSKPVS